MAFNLQRFSRAVKMKALALTLGLVGVLLAGLWAIQMSVGSLNDSIRRQTMSLEGRRLLYQMQVRLHAGEELGESPMRAERFGAGYFAGPKGEGIWWGSTEHQEKARELCPDCILTDESFKLIAIGNVDEDPELDVWIQKFNEVSPSHLVVD